MLFSGGPARKLLLLLGLCAAHRLVILAWTTTIGADGPPYMAAAQAFARKDTDAALRSLLHPLYPFLSAGIGSFVGNLELGGYLVSILASTLAVVPFYFWTRKWAGDRVATWACLLYSLHPILALECSEVRNTGLFIGLFITALSTGLLAVGGAHGSLYVISGIATGLCFLTRPEGVAVALIVAAAAVTALVRGVRSREKEGLGNKNQRVRWARLAVGTLVAGALCAGVMSPYLLWIKKNTGRWSLTPRPSANALWRQVEERIKPPDPSPVPPVTVDPPRSQEIPPSQPRPEKNPSAPAPASSPSPEVLPPPKAAPSPPSERPLAIRRSGGKESRLRHTAKEFSRALYWPMLIPLSLGLIFHRKAGASKSALISTLTMALVVWTPPCLYFWLDPEGNLTYRYLLAGTVLTLPWAAIGVLLTEDRIQQACSNRPAGSGRILVPVAGCGLLLIALLAKSIGPRREDEVTYLEAGRWLREQKIPPSRQIVDATGKVAYYAGCGSEGIWIVKEYPRWTWIGESWTLWDGVSNVRTYSHFSYLAYGIVMKREAPFLVVDERLVRHYYDEGFLDELLAVGFELVQRFDKGDPKNAKPVLIFHHRNVPR